MFRDDKEKHHQSIERNNFVIFGSFVLTSLQLRTIYKYTLNVIHIVLCMPEVEKTTIEHKHIAERR